MIWTILSYTISVLLIANLVYMAYLIAVLKKEDK